MVSKVEALKRQAAKLSDDERAELALSLIQSLDSPVADDGVDCAWEAEIARRAGEIERGDVETAPGDAVLSRIRHALG